MTHFGLDERFCHIENKESDQSKFCAINVKAREGLGESLEIKGLHALCMHSSGAKIS